MKKRMIACLLVLAMIFSSVAPMNVDAQELPEEETVSSDIQEDEVSTVDVVKEESVDETSVVETENNATESAVQEEIVEVQNEDDINTIGDVEIVSISIPDHEIMQYTNGWENESWYGDSNESVKWYYYYPENFVRNITVTFSDGYVQECTDAYGFTYGDQWYSFDFITDQSDMNPWGVGNHAITVNLNGFESTFNVNIVEGPVDSFEFINPEVYEGTQGYWTEGYVDETGVTEYWYSYEFWNLPFKVTLKDGTVLKSDGGGFSYNGEWFSPMYSIDQSYENPLSANGEYTVSVSIMGSKVDTKVKIVESPVESLEVENLEIIVGTNCEIRNEWLDDNTYGQYYYYNLDNADYKITFKDGTVINNEYNSKSFEYDDVYYELGLLTDQSYYNQWTPGNTYTATLAAMGVKEEVTVNVVECPISSVHFEDVNIIEGMGGEIYYSWNDETQCEEEWYRYKLEEYVPEFEIVFEDGTVVNTTNSASWDSENFTFGFEYKGNTCSIASHDIGQNVKNPWTRGTYVIPVTIMGQEYSYNVNIIESPYTSLEVLNVEVLKENQNGYFDENGNFIYYVPAISFEIYLNDGTSEIMFADSKTSFSNNVFEKLTVTHNQSEIPWTVGGENYFTVEYAGVSAQIPVKIKSENTFEYIEQNGAAYITGVKSAQKVLEVPAEIDGLPVKGIISLASDSWEINYGVKEIIIPDSVMTISEDAIPYNMSSVEKITIGSGVEFLSVDTFGYCRELTSIMVSEANPYYCDIDGVLYNKDVTTLVAYPCAKGDSYVVPKTVTNIDSLNAEIYNSLSITYEEGSVAFVTVDDVTYTADMTKVIYCNPSKKGVYVMPDSVTEVADNAFSGCNALTEVEISENVTSIVYGMFMNCSSLASVQMPASIESIDASAFQRCESLETIDLPDNLKSINNMAFTSSGIKNITIPENVKRIGANAFSWTNLSGSVVIPDAVEEIGIQAFCNTDITDISVGTGTTSIGNSAFSGTKIAEITIPDNVTYLGESVFNGCDNLKEAYVGSGITAILSNAFSKCATLEKVVLANENVTLGEAAFAGTPLKELNFENVKGYIGMAAFAGNDFTSVSLSEGVTGVGYIAFSGCMDLEEISMPTSIERVEALSLHTSGWYQKAETGLNYIDSVLYDYKGEMPAGTEVVVKDGTTVLADAAFEDQKGLTKITLPEGLKTIGSGTFSGCTNLTEINIPASVTDINEGAFLECSELTAINVAEGNPVYSSVDGVLYNKSGTELIFVPKQDAEKFEVPTSVERIKKWAFGYSGVEKIVIPNANTIVEDKAIGYFCNIINKRYFVTIECVENSYAHQYAIDNLLDVMFIGEFIATGVCGSNAIWTLDNDYVLRIEGSGVVTENTYNQEYNELIRKVIISEDITSLGDYAFYGCKKLEEIYIPEKLTAIGAYALVNCESLEKIIVSENNTVLDSRNGCNAIIETSTNKLLYGCENSVIPDDVAAINAYAFAGCKGLKNIVIPDAVTSIGDFAFSECKSLEEIVLSQNVTELGNYVFQHCSNLATVCVDEGNTVYDSRNNCNGIIETATNTLKAGCFNTVIPDTVVKIGPAFIGCDKLTKIDIPNSVREIANEAFSGCVNLVEITVPESVTDVGELAFNSVPVVHNLSGLSSDTWGAVVVHNTAFEDCFECGNNSIVASGTCGESAVWSLDEKGVLTISGTGTINDYSGYSAYAEEILTLVIQEGITNIGDSAFCACTQITGEVIIPESVLFLGYEAFSSNSFDKITFLNPRCTIFDGKDTINSSIKIAGYRNSSAQMYAAKFSRQFEQLVCMHVWATEYTIDKMATCIEEGVKSIHCTLCDVSKEGTEQSIPMETEHFLDEWYVYKEATYTEEGEERVECAYHCGYFMSRIIEKKPITSITFKQNVFGLSLNQQLTIVTTENFNNLLNWSSSDEKVAKVNADGAVTAIGEGECYIIAHAGQIEAYCKIIVSDGIVSGSCGTNAIWLYTKDKTLIIAGKGALNDKSGYKKYKTEAKKLIIEEGITSICSEAFSEFKALEGDLIIPEGVTEIGNKAFYFCSGMKGSLSLPDSLTSIGAEAFGSCAFTGWLILPARLKELGRYAFVGCDFIGDLTIPETLTSISYGAFSQCYGFSGKLVLPDTITKLEDHAFSGCGFTGQLIIPTTISELGSAFFGCSGFTGTLIIPDNIQVLSESCFSGCTGLSGEVIVPESVTKIGPYVFKDTNFSKVIIMNKDCEIWDKTKNTIPTSITVSGYQRSTAEEYAKLLGNYFVPLPETIVASGMCGDTANWILDEEGLLIISGTGEISDSEGYKFYKDNIKKVVIDLEIESIGDNAFQGLTNWTGDCVMPNTVTRIGAYAFDNCTGLDGVLILPDNIEYIGAHAFEMCSSLQVTFGSLPKLKEIGAYSFHDCGKIQGSLYLSKEISLIGEGAFGYFSELERIEILNPECIIGDTMNTIPGITVICGYKNSTAEDYANSHNRTFEEYIDLISSGTCGDSATWLLATDGTLYIKGTGEMGTAPYGYEYYKDQITNLVIQEGITKIGDCAFENCSDLSIELDIPDSVTEIGAQAFGGCTKLTGPEGKLIIPENIEIIGSNAFSSCYGFYGELEILSKSLSIGYGAFTDCSNLSGELILPEGVISVGDYAFEHCHGLKTANLVFPDSLESIGDYAFYGCEPFEGELKLPKNLKKIGANTFAGCERLVGEIDLPSTLVEIGDYAFAGCTGLTGDLIIPDSVEYIGEEAFVGCNGIWGEFSLPKNLKHLGRMAFYDCWYLFGELIISPYLDMIPYGAFGHSKCLDGDVFLPENVTAVESEAFAGCYDIDKIVFVNPDCFIEDSETTIEECIVISGQAGSTAEAYANKYNRVFEIDTHEHISSNKEIVVREATCLVEGLKTDVCKLCYTTYEIVIPTIDHTWDEGTETKASTCIEKGITHYKCLNCSATKEEEIDYSEHVWDETYTVDKDPTCSEEGVQSIHCNVCDIVQDGSEIPVEMIPHTWDKGTETKTPTCIEKGITHYECLNCNATKEEEIDYSEHVWDETYTVDKDSTCSKEGVQSIHCSVCDIVQEGSEIPVEMIPHTWDKGIETKAPTCIEKGNTHYECLDCEATKDEEIDYAEHVWDETYTVDKDSTCSKEGVQSIHCSVCDMVKEGSEIPVGMIPHAWDEGTETKTPTCIEKGNTHYECLDCEATKDEEIDYADHAWDELYTVDKEASCSEEGIESIHCGICDTVKEGSQQSIPTTDHMMSEWFVDVAASYSKEGQEKRVCTGCDYEETRAIEKVVATGIVLNKDEVEIFMGDTNTITAFCSPIAHLPGEVVWSSSDNDVAVVDQNGVVKGVAAGTAIIIAKIGIHSAECTVKIIPGEWRQDSTGWWYYKADGSYPRNCWQDIDGEKYYFDSYGYRVENAWQDGYWLDSEGHIVKNAWVDGDRYYVGEDGQYVRNCWVDDGKYYVNANGERLQNSWLKQPEGWYYFGGNGQTCKGWFPIDGIWYMGQREHNGLLLQNEWYKEGTNVYYFVNSCAMATGWQSIGGNDYYFGTSGAMYKNTWAGVYWVDEDGIKITNAWVADGKSYVDANGAKQTGWLKLDGDWYYFGTDGVLQKGWIRVGNTEYYGDKETGRIYEQEWLDDIYYFQAGGAKVTGWYQIDGNYYYFTAGGEKATNRWIGAYWVDADGIMATNTWLNDGKVYVGTSGAKQTGWLSYEGNWYYFGTNGVLQTDWIRVGNIWYYADKETGRIYEQEWLDDTYYFHAGGAMATGWLDYEGSWYYLGTDGKVQTAWIRVGNTWYYGDKETGRIYEEEWLDNTYYFKKGGAMVTGWHLIDGEYYYFSVSGAKLTNVWIGNYYLKADGKMAVNEWIGSYYVGADGAWIPGYAR